MNRGLLLAGTFALVALGCGQTVPTYDQMTIDTADQFRKVGMAYTKAYQKKRSPPTVDDLKAYLKQQGENPDTLLTSPRDGQPLVIVTGFSPDKEAKGDELPIVAYEKNGVNGRRVTVDSRGTVVLYSDADFAKLEFVGGHKPGQ